MPCWTDSMKELKWLKDMEVIRSSELVAYAYENGIIQEILDIIDSRITDNITLRDLAVKSGYSASHLGRLFSKVTGITLMAYTTRRKLHYALYDIGCGEKILDVAVKYGFETHAGFTKACKKHFGYPPSIYRM